MTTAQSKSATLNRNLIERVADRLDVDPSAGQSLECLERVYLAWCQNVPFDSVLKRIHIAGGEVGALPVSDPEDFFEMYLDHGTGGTCWPISEAFLAFLRSVGFDARRIAGAMLDFPQIPAPNHGTLVVRIGQQEYLVDPFMLSEIPLPLTPGRQTVVEKYPSLRLEASGENGRFVVHWRFPANRNHKFRFGSLPEFNGTGAQVFSDRYALTGGTNSAFNHSLYIVTNRGDEIHSLYQGDYTVVSADDRAVTRPVGDDRDRILKDIFRLSDEIIARLPEDSPSA